MPETNLERWHSPMGVRIPKEMVADMRAQPRFVEAVHWNARELLAQYYNRPSQHRSFVDGGRQVLAVLAVYLGVTGGVTHRRLRDLAGEGTALSTGRTTALLMQMRWMGYLEPVLEAKRGSVRKYMPTAGLFEDFVFRIRIDLESLALVAPEIAPLAAQLGTPRILQTFATDFGASILSASRLPDPDVAPVSDFYLRNGGMPTLFALYENAADDDYRARHATIAMTALGLSKQFGVSRTQIARLMQDAAAAGFIRQASKQGAVQILPEFLDVFETFWAIYFVGLASSAHRTFLALAAEGDASLA